MISIGKWVPTLLNLILKHNVNNDRKFHRDIKDANTFSQELRKLLKTKYYLSCTLNSTMALKEWVLRILKRQVHHNESFFSRCWRIDSLFWICWAAQLDRFKTIHKSTLKYLEGVKRGPYYLLCPKRPQNLNNVFIKSVQKSWNRMEQMGWPYL